MRLKRNDQGSFTHFVFCKRLGISVTSFSMDGMRQRVVYSEEQKPLNQLMRNFPPTWINGNYVFLNAVLFSGRKYFFVEAT